MSLEVTAGPVLIPREGDSGVPLGSSGRARLKILNQGPGETGYALVEAGHPPGQPAIRDHVHARHDETFVVIEGQYEVRLDDDVVVAGLGDCVYVPRGTPHTYRNPGPGPAIVLNIMSPADGVLLLAELGARAGAAVSEAELAELHARHSAFLVDPLPRWQARAGLGGTDPREQRGRSNATGGE